MNQETQRLIYDADICANYLSQTHRGAIRVDMRLDTIRVLRRLSAEARHEINAHLNTRNQLANAYYQIDLRDRRMAEIIANQAQVATAEKEKQQREYEQKVKEANDEKAKLHKDVEDLKKNKDEELVNLAIAHEEIVRNLTEELEKEKTFKQNSNKILSLALDFCIENRLGIVGYMHEHGINNFDINILRELRDTLYQNPDQGFQADSDLMLLVNTLNTMNIGNRIENREVPPQLPPPEEVKDER